MSDAPVDPNEGWDSVGDPYPPIDAPISDDSGPETDPEEDDPEEEDPGEDSEEYIPHGYDSEHDAESDADEVPPDAQDPENGIIDEETVLAPLPPPQPTHCCPRGKDPIAIPATHWDGLPVTARYLYGLNPIPQGGACRRYEIGGTTGHYELGGSSHAPLPAVVPRIDAPTTTQHIQVVHEVERLADREVIQSDALQTLYCRVGTDRTHSNTMGAHIRALEYRLEIAEREIRASERERRQLREQLADLIRYVRRRFD